MELVFIFVFGFDLLFGKELDGGLNGGDTIILQFSEQNRAVLGREFTWNPGCDSRLERLLVISKPVREVMDIENGLL